MPTDPMSNADPITVPAATSPAAVALPSHSTILRPLWVLTLLSVLIIGWHSRTWNEPLERDIVTGILMGRGLHEGWRLYVDMIEFKPPGHYIIWMLVDLVTGTGPWAVAAVGTAVSILTMLGTYHAGRAVLRSTAGGLWAALFWTLCGGEYGLEANEPNIEVFMNLFMVWGVALLVHSRATAVRPLRFAGIGALFFAATLQKHHLGLAVVAVVAAWSAGLSATAAGRRAAVKNAAVVGLTLLLGWAGVVVYYAGTGRLRPFYDQLVGLARFYAASRGGINPVGTASVVDNLVMGLRPDYLAPGFTWFLLLLVALVVAGSWLLVWPLRTAWAVLLLAAWALATQVVVSAPGTFFPHYYQLWLPVLCVGGGWAVAALSSFRQAGNPLGAWAGCVVALSLAWPSISQVSMTPDEVSVFKYGNVFPLFRDAGYWLDRNLPPGETFYQWGNDPGMYYYAHRRPPTGVFWEDRLTAGPLRDGLNEKVLRELRADPPRLAVVQGAVPTYGSVSRWLSEAYVPVPNAYFGYGFNLAVRRDLVVRTNAGSNAISAATSPATTSTRPSPRSR